MSRLLTQFTIMHESLHTLGLIHSRVLTKEVIRRSSDASCHPNVARVVRSLVMLSTLSFQMTANQLKVTTSGWIGPVDALVSNAPHVSVSRGIEVFTLASLARHFKLD